MAKNGHVHEGEKVGRSSATPIKLFPKNYYDLKFMAFEFFNDFFITFEMPKSSHAMIFWKIIFCRYSVHLYSEVLEQIYYATQSQIAHSIMHPP